MSVTADIDVQYLQRRIEVLTQAVLHLAMELWTSKDRAAVLEHVLREAGIDAPRLVSDHNPDADMAARLASERERFIESFLETL